MRSLLADSLAAVAVASLLTLQCGGRVDGASPAGCPADLSAACSSGDTCDETVTDCAGTFNLTCECNGGAWACPAYGAACSSECEGAAEGTSCTTPNLSCPGPTQCAAAPGTDTCLCDGAHFTCTTTACPAPGPACPPPSEVQSGVACSAPPSTWCAGVVACGDGSTAETDCSCDDGRWFCESFANPCMSVADGGADEK